MKLLIDMNLAPKLCAILAGEGWDTIHWSTVGSGIATDYEIMQWAKANQRIVITHDLDFGSILAVTQATGPSVLQVRTQDVRPLALGPLLISVLRQYELELKSGALLIVERARLRVRLLPLSGT